MAAVRAPCGGCPLAYLAMGGGEGRGDGAQPQVGRQRVMHGGWSTRGEAEANPVDLGFWIIP